ncbi:MAG: hypothetical protein H6Q19_1963 [Bacteroidetes bacterium]|nr:hypothetical protein [Bacteroidota bacterium]
MRKFTLLVIALMSLTLQSSFAWDWPQCRNYNGSTPEQPSTIYLGDQATFGHDSWSKVNDKWPKWRVAIHTTSDINNGTFGTWSGYGDIEHKTALSPVFTSIGTWYWGMQVEYTDAGGTTGWYCRDITGWENMYGTPTSNLTVNVSNIVDPSSQSATTSSYSDINLSWTKNAKGNNVLVVRYAHGVTPTAPTNGTAYTSGNSIGTGTVIFNGSETSTTSSGLNSSTTYDYYLYSVNNNYYSTGVFASATTASKNTDYFRSKATGNWDTATNWESSFDGTIWITSTLAPTSGAAGVIIENEHTISINNLATASSVTIKPKGQLTLNSGYTFTVSGNFQIQSDGVGTGTFVDKNTTGGCTINGTTQVQQYLVSDRQWWYLASPLSGASSSVFSGDQIGKYVEDYLNDNDGNTKAPYYTSPFSIPETLAAGRGYVIKRASTTAATYTFTGGSLNNADVILTPTRTGTAAARGFNLVGNPYPSYLDWDAVYTDVTNPAVNMRNAIWFRTYDTQSSAMVFHTYSDGYSVPLNANITGKIAPMQAFWVKVATDGSNGSLTFKNDHRSHYSATGYNPLKVKTAETRPCLRIAISNGANTDEALIVGKSYASNALDSYDIEKMSANNTAIPEIYSVLDNNELVINSMNTLAEGTTVNLGFRPGQAGTFTLLATQLENIDAKVILVDKLTGTETELNAGTAYNFTSDATTTTDRFSLVLRTPGMVTGVDNTASNLEVSATQGSIVICGTTPGSTVRVYNTVGQQLTSATATGSRTELRRDFTPGIYLVKVNNRTMKVSVK